MFSSTRFRRPFIESLRLWTDAGHAHFRSTGVKLFSASSSSLNHYRTLELDRDATAAQIKANYYRLSKQYHPDINKRQSAVGRFKRINEAYAVLSDAKERRKYDREMFPGGGSSAQDPFPADWKEDAYREKREREFKAATEKQRRPKSGVAATTGSFYFRPSFSNALAILVVLFGMFQYYMYSFRMKTRPSAPLEIQSTPNFNESNNKTTDYKAWMEEYRNKRSEWDELRRQMESSRDEEEKRDLLRRMGNWEPRERKTVVLEDDVDDG